MPTTPLPADDLLFTTQFDNYAGYDSYVAAQMLMQAISEFQDKRMATEVAISQSNLEQQKKWQSIKRKLAAHTTPDGSIKDINSGGTQNALTADEIAYLKGGVISYTGPGGTIQTISVEGILSDELKNTYNNGNLSGSGTWQKDPAQQVMQSIQNQLDRFSSDGTATQLRMQDITNKKSVSTETWSSIQKAKKQVLDAITRGIAGG